MKNALLAALLLFAVSPAFGQSAITQDGSVRPNDVGKFSQDRHMRSAGGLQGDTVGRGVNPFSVTDSNGLAECAYTDNVNNPYHAFCFGHDAQGNAKLYIQSNGAANTGFKIELNGLTYDWPTNGNTPLTMPANVYVATNGSDANDCLTALTACHSINHAIAQGATSLLSAGNSLVVNLAAGIYSESVFVSQPLTGGFNTVPNPNGTNSQPGQILLSGIGSSAVTLNGSGYCGTIVSSNFAMIGVRGIKLLGTGTSCQSTLFTQLGGIINIYDDVEFGAANVEHIHNEDLGQTEAWFDYKISGNATRHVIASQGAVYIHNGFPSGNITFIGTPTFSDAFAVAAENGTVQWNSNVTWTGSFNGTRYFVYDNGVIATYPSTSVTWIPGTGGGTAANGGIYHGPLNSVIGALRSTGEGVYSHASCFDLADIKCSNDPWLAAPVIAFGGLSTGITYSSQIGYYAQFNKLIIATFDVTLTSKGSATGSAGVLNLPFQANASQLGTCAIGFTANMSGLTSSLFGWIQANTSSVNLAEQGATGVANIDDSNFTNTSRISGVCTYATN